MSSFSKIKHKTYDTSKGFGDSDKWKSAFKERMQVFENEEEGENPFSTCTTRYEVKKLYRSLAMFVHPDRGGKQEDFIKLEKQYRNELLKYK